MLHTFQLHHLIGQEFERPTLPPIGSLATRQMNQLGFPLASPSQRCSGRARWKASGESHFQILLHKPLFDANHGAATDV